MVQERKLEAQTYQKFNQPLKIKKCVNMFSSASMQKKLYTDYVIGNR